MKKKIKIYKTPEEIEKFNENFYQRVCIQELLMRASVLQQRHLNYQMINGDKKSLLKFDFSAS
jgi:hypothetical protein